MNDLMTVFAMWAAASRGPSRSLAICPDGARLFRSSMLRDCSPIACVQLRTEAKDFVHLCSERSGRADISCT